VDWVGLEGGKSGEVGKHRNTELAGAEDEDGARGGGRGLEEEDILGSVPTWKWKTSIGRKGTKDLRSEKMKMEYRGSYLLWNLNGIRYPAQGPRAYDICPLNRPPFVLR
jgi:hypothetical protein